MIADYIRPTNRARPVTRLCTSNTVEPRFNEVAGDRPNLFVKWRVRYIEVLFHTFYWNFGRDIVKSRFHCIVNIFLLSM